MNTFKNNTTDFPSDGSEDINLDNQKRTEKPNFDKSDKDKFKRSKNRNRNRKDFKTKNRTYRQENFVRERIPNRTSNVSVGKNDRPFSVVNLSSSVIAGKHFNQNVVASDFRDVQAVNIPIKLTIRPDRERLLAQAKVWARRVISTNEIIFRYIFGNRFETWIKYLEDMYIYSYFNCVLTALREKDKTTSYVDPPVRMRIAGHALLYNSLRNTLRTTFSSGSINITYNFDVTQEDYDFIYNMANTFSFIKSSINDDFRFSFENDMIERFFKALAETFTDDEPKLFNMYESTSSIYNMLNVDNYPLANSFYTTRNSGENPDLTSWFYCYNSDYTVLDMSSLFGKALFVTSKDDLSNSKYYDLNNVDDNFTLVKWEVTCLAGCDYPDYYPTMASQPGGMDLK